MDPITLAALADFPDRLEAYYSVVPLQWLLAKMAAP